MYREGKEGELNKESTCVNMEEINKQCNVLLCKTHNCWTKHIVFESPVLGLEKDQDWTQTSQDRKGPQPQSSLQSFMISKIPGLGKDQSGPVWTSLLIGKFINILSVFRTLIY